jgi:hypothetical protein
LHRVDKYLNLKANINETTEDKTMRKLKALIAWCKSLRSIVRTYRGDNDRIHQRIAELEKIIRETQPNNGVYRN